MEGNVANQNPTGGVREGVGFHPYSQVGSALVKRGISKALLSFG